MRILIDIGHPGHVHLFKHLAKLLEQKCHAEILFTVRDKEFEIDLLKAADLSYKNLGKHYSSLPGKIWGLLEFNIKLLFVALKFKPDLFISHGSIFAAHVSFLLGKKHLSMEDTGNMEQIYLYRPFTDVILTPEVLKQELGPKQIRYNGYHEIAYLHHDFFTPDPAIYKWLGLPPNTPYAIFRFISWNATHDVGQKGLTNEDKMRLVEKLSKHMKIFISSEANLPEKLAPFQIKIAPEKLHDALYYANIVISEGSTTASEAGVLGTPTIFINSMQLGYCIDQEKYGLVFNTTESSRVFSLVDDILQESRKVYRERSKKLLSEKLNVTRYLFDFIIERYNIKTSSQPKELADIPS